MRWTAFVTMCALGRVVVWPQPGFESMAPEMKDGLNKMTDMGNAFIFAFAGHDTTGHTLTWLTYEMAKNPTLQVPPSPP